MGILDEIEKMAEMEDTVEMLRSVLRNQKEIIQRLEKVEKQLKQLKSSLKKRE
ncbi:MAG: hypothetical protein J7K08_06835 [Thermoplasmata archaeon]|nr:hypothetical protein [Thermoplasmata archaeon]